MWRIICGLAAVALVVGGCGDDAEPPAEVTMAEWLRANRPTVDELNQAVGDVELAAQSGDRERLRRQCRDLGFLADDARREPPPQSVDRWREMVRTFADAAAFCEDGARRRDVQSMEAGLARLDQAASMLGSFERCCMENE